jgi:hypothetical protein
MTDRVAWLQSVADYYMDHGRLPLLPLPDESPYVHGEFVLSFIGCEMIMVSDTKPGRLDFTGHWPGATLVAFRNKPVPDKVVPDSKNRKGNKSEA